MQIDLIYDYFVNTSDSLWYLFILTIKRSKITKLTDLNTEQEYIFYFSKTVVEFGNTKKTSIICINNMYI